MDLSAEGRPAARISALIRWFHTLRHLRPIQVYGRVRHTLVTPRSDSRPHPPLRALQRHLWVCAATREPSLLTPTGFRFLNEIHDVVERGWDDPQLRRLWRYNLHYFADLTAREADTRASWHRALLERWVTENPPGKGTGWEPYPTSLRIVNWIKWALSGHALPPASVQSLAVQARWLSKRLEHHLLGNHLFANAKAMIFVGAFFEGEEARSWVYRGCKILDRELREQVLADGGHFERSPMYHALALEDVADLCNLARVVDSYGDLRWRPLVHRLQGALQPMRRWLAGMCHPDGEIAFFNDAAFGVAPTLAQLQGYLSRLGSHDSVTISDSVTLFAQTGYVRVEQRDAVALLDVGEIGPDYLPGHAHADTLSFELSVFGHRVLVNSGTSLYDAGPERSRQRGTSAHNAVVVNGMDSSELWKSFRVGRRARPWNLQVTESPLAVRCAHDGYRRLPGRVTHSREWVFDHNGLRVDDLLQGSFETAQARFHLHPSVEVAMASASEPGSSAALRIGERLVCIAVEGGILRLEPTTWHPEFGISVPNRCVSVVFNGRSLRTTFTWTSLA